MVNANQLAARDPAKAALMGAIAGNSFGFGDDYGFGAYGRRGAISAYDPSANIGFGGQWGWGAAAPPPAPLPMHLAPPPPPPPPAPPHPMDFGHPLHHVYHPHMYGHAYGQQHWGHHWPAPHYGVGTPQYGPPPAGESAEAWQHSYDNPASTASRTFLLDPNRDSKVKVERYSFSFSPPTPLTLGTSSDMGGSFTQQPSTSIKGQRVIMNAPIPGFVTVDTLQVANVNVFVGTTEDAFTYFAGAQGVMLDLPRLDPQNRATANGFYTGALPAGYTSGMQFQFIITLQGPSVLAGGYGQ